MSEWKMPAGVKRHPLPPEAVLPAKAKSSRARTPLTPTQLKWRAQKAKADAAAADFKKRCLAAGLPLPVREYQFARDAMARAWKADFAWPDERVILEVEGGAWSGGRHTRGSGYLQDMAKYNAAAVLGYTLLRCTPSTLNTADTLALVRAALTRSRP